MQYCRTAWMGQPGPLMVPVKAEVNRVHPHMVPVKAGVNRVHQVGPSSRLLLPDGQTIDPQEFLGVYCLPFSWLNFLELMCSSCCGSILLSGR